MILAANGVLAFCVAVSESKLYPSYSRVFQWKTSRELDGVSENKNSEV